MEPAWNEPGSNAFLDKSWVKRKIKRSPLCLFFGLSRYSKRGGTIWAWAGLQFKTLVDCFIDLSIDSMVHWFMKSMIHWFIDPLMSSFIVSLFRYYIDALNDSMIH